ncbi:MAG: fumarylacetoacetate hydrolase family protein, partial [Bryobacteraceae bacterium]
MAATRRQVLGSMLAAGAGAAQAPPTVTRYVRFERNGAASYGLVEGDSVRPISGSLFGRHKPNGTKVRLSSVKLLAPCEPPKILAVGLNYRSHIGNRPAPTRPEIFYKPISSLQRPDGEIVIPKDANNVHYEGELVIVIGRTVRQASREQAIEAIFGVTCGNDVSERDWQNGADKDLQWWRAKGADTFSCL